MVVVMNLTAGTEQINAVQQRLEQFGFEIHIIRGVNRLVIGAVGDRRIISSLGLEAMPGVEKIVPIMKPFKLVSRESKGQSSLIKVKNVIIGGDDVVVIAGPCAVESREQLLTAARMVRQAGAVILRGGAFKPRTSPYSFQGLEEEGLKLLAEASAETGLVTVTEIIDEASLELARDYVDMIQVGARNMQNFRLLRAVGRSGKPVLLKRGLSATIEEWLMAAEYVISEGNENVVLCERGIRTFETATRNTLDLSAVPVVKGQSHLPVIVDPSHATGERKLVAPMSMAALAAGADGLLIEVHPEPDKALSDGPQSLTPEDFSSLMAELRRLAPAIGRRIR
ncbi:3-deoxy-7-phosphoheptulonate synthase [Pelotomaculum terephthalicicum JT]|uniref:3-deoxy-7-phosphoheptulonate synthase n=1 Tax=Pelotomaculum TaxID=191373 RepID=UPI0009D57EF9|nr:MULTISPECIES: 3-deoxy-7-phosphoheptulonate synthase [Pelotomaculum]MCG9969470.1 3-deoxy-7-phosphoheptulonate synthase [Pelotomaculum terephthalicicum JT]OPX88708.1 MAG: Phospho-2-dehydro-3-deoxyheptonate aldolase [Pelotomaculum sp. PtaB.Bin117]OPY60566.1 MAG: Phospho-2-dehydro-3-deoxyheptonate aldolase [Pelotomaculum sp. PtaU1.Bin065]